MNLLEHIEKYPRKTDKYDLGYIHNIYNTIFSPIKDTTRNLLEIGIYHGDSIILWRDYFTNADVSCVDINKCERLSSQDRIFPFYTNAYSNEFLNSIKDNFYDIVIDDGPHTFDSMVFFLSNYLNKVKDGGFLILEDIIDSSWTPKLASLIDTTKNSMEIFDMRNKQLTPTLLNRWKNGLDVIVIKKGVV